jgi:hypothetical protein
MFNFHPNISSIFRLSSMYMWKNIFHVIPMWHKDILRILCPHHQNIPNIFVPIHRLMFRYSCSCARFPTSLKLVKVLNKFSVARIVTQHISNTNRWVYGLPHPLLNLMGCEKFMGVAKKPPCNGK